MLLLNRALSGTAPSIVPLHLDVHEPLARSREGVEPHTAAMEAIRRLLHRDALDNQFRQLLRILTKEVVHQPAQRRLILYCAVDIDDM